MKNLEEITQEILHELFSSLEALDTQSGAVLQFLKDKGIAPDEELAPYLDRAGAASDVRWRAARARIDHLVSSAIKTAQENREADNQKEPAKSGEETPEARPGVNEKAQDQDKGNEGAMQRPNETAEKNQSGEATTREASVENQSSPPAPKEETPKRNSSAENKEEKAA